MARRRRSRRRRGRGRGVIKVIRGRRYRCRRLKSRRRR